MELSDAYFYFDFLNKTKSDFIDEMSKRDVLNFVYDYKITEHMVDFLAGNPDNCTLYLDTNDSLTIFNVYNLCIDFRRVYTDHEKQIRFSFPYEISIQVAVHCVLSLLFLWERCQKYMLPNGELKLIDVEF